MDDEKYGQRDLTYSAWHRAKSTARFVGIENAQLLGLIDVDASLWVEWERDTKEPVALIETAMDVGEYKTATVMKNLARRANLPCFVVLYTVGITPNPSNRNYMDIASFRVKRLHPKESVGWEILTPQEWAEKLLAMRRWSAKKLDEAVAF